MTKGTHGRDASLATQMLEQSLRRLQTDHLDLWQIHGVGFDNASAAPPGRINSSGSAMGSTGLQVSILGMGGYHLGAVAGQEQVNYGCEGARPRDKLLRQCVGISRWHERGTGRHSIEGKRDQAIVMTKVCTHGRKKDVAMRMLEESLTRLQTDHLDVWQVHEVIYYNDPNVPIRPMASSKHLRSPSSKARFVLSASQATRTPRSTSKCSIGGFHFDTVQMPINPFDPSYRSFELHVLPIAVQKGMAVFFDGEHERLRRADRARRSDRPKPSPMQ
jgi:aryl-alcohol dehydrogenase-like predicted oxidoreductase